MHTSESCSHHFLPFDVETSGAFESEALSLTDIGRHTRTETGEPCSYQFLHHGIAVAVQWENVALIMGMA